MKFLLHLLDEGIHDILQEQLLIVADGAHHVAQLRVDPVQSRRHAGRKPVGHLIGKFRRQGTDQVVLFSLIVYDQVLGLHLGRRNQPRVETVQELMQGIRHGLISGAQAVGAGQGEHQAVD